MMEMRNCGESEHAREDEGDRWLYLALWVVIMEATEEWCEVVVEEARPFVDEVEGGVDEAGDGDLLCGRGVRHDLLRKSQSTRRMSEYKGAFAQGSVRTRQRSHKAAMAQGSSSTKYNARCRSRCGGVEGRWKETPDATDAITLVESD